ncbi:Hsp20/alpha crystallin family protein [Fictibacillus iocasae]|uniref:Hsp20/alpha crystallin family protein n=1 Tax=Fictibacillus iocasae TaxID=2715437 RepID=A0ABW2NX79_9BACL
MLSFNDRSLSSWLKSFEDLVDKGFIQYKQIMENLSFMVETDETPDTYIIQAHLQDYRMKDIQLEVFDQAVRIVAQRNETTQLENALNKTRQTASQVKRIERVIPLPFRVRQEDLRATFGDGVLKIAIPKKALPNYIDIEIEDEQ